MIGKEICQSFSFLISEAEICSILLDTKPFLYRILNKKVHLKFCNPQLLDFEIVDIFDNSIFFKYAKLSLDFRKNVINKHN